MSAEDAISVAVVGGGFLFFTAWEAIAPLRRTLEPKLRHVIRNLTVGGVSLAILTLIQAPILVPVAAWATRHRIGLLTRIALPAPLDTIAAIILLDYTLWWWHRASHQVPFLWRFHLPHHVDLDLDASTALRFHFGELTLSIAYRSLQIVLIGTTVFQLWLWQTILFASILFHHSNARLPIPFERVLVYFIATPRMHGIHHSDRLNETNSNWASLLSIWDFIHRTIVLDVPQAEITIGVPAYQDAADVTIGKVLALPFKRQRSDWQRVEVVQ
ncbi:MAG TPA: sterol desaturase family protein [Thermoanaerobaculia bacterium]|nr:sterol desaturase family protein [Thermoanaerobaculia bacterium]